MPTARPHLRQLPRVASARGARRLRGGASRDRLPERHLLDVLKRAEHWVALHPPLRAALAGRPEARPPGTALLVHRLRLRLQSRSRPRPRVTPPRSSAPQAMRRINAQHIDAARLEKAMADLIGAYDRFPLPRHLGCRAAPRSRTGRTWRCARTACIGSRHIRYGGYGAIAYHHIADSYVALFTTVIPCGVWEAVHILDGLLKNRSALQPDTLHADTQGQSAPVFGLCRLLGIRLMPRMRGLGDAVFYRPDQVRALPAYRRTLHHRDRLGSSSPRIGADMLQVGPLDSGRPGPALDAAEKARLVQSRKAGSTSLSANSAGSSAPCSCCAIVSDFADPPHHPRRDHQDRVLQRLPRLDHLRRPSHPQRRPGRAGEVAQIRQPRRQRDHALQRRQHERGARRPWRRTGCPSRPELAACDEPLQAQAHPPLRTIRPRHG